MSPRALVALAVAGLGASLGFTFSNGDGNGGGDRPVVSTPPADVGAGPPLRPQPELARAPEPKAPKPAPPAAPAARAGVDAYRGAGAWVDQYDAEVLDDPLPALEQMRDRGVKTVYLETGSWRLPRSRDFRDRRAMRLMIDQAHGLGMKVVAWYLPGLTDVALDMRRTRAALRLRSPKGAPFDGFAPDIESQRIRQVAPRNRALMRYSRALRQEVGEDYALGAIVPDERSSTVSPALWPSLPYGPLAEIYDVFLPMAYSTFRGHGAGYVYRYTRSNVEFVRRVTGRPVHIIGGLDPGLRPSEPAAVVRAARDGGAIGASFYDYVGATASTWRALKQSP